MIKARVKAENPAANLKSYYETYRGFSWSEMEKEVHPGPYKNLNIVLHAIDRWADDPDKRDRPALIFEKGETTLSYSYLDLKKESCRWANILARHGFGKGERLFIFLPTTPEIYFAMVGCARIGVIFSVLYPTLRFEEARWRILNAKPMGILTNRDLAEKLAPDAMKIVQNVFLISGEAPGLHAGEIVVEDLLMGVPDQFEAALFPRDTPLYLLYSSGSTGPPKGVVHAHQDMFGHLMTAKYVLNLNENSIVWTDANPAWVTGTVYGAFAPWLCGATSVVQSEPFSASTWYRTLEKHKVSVWYTTPSTVRKLTAAGADLPGRYSLSFLNHICTVGEALGPELFYWAKEHLKHSVHDTWWMTETGMICIANFPSEPIKPGSMGKPVPGIEAGVIDNHGNPLPFLTLGQLALKVGWPAMMTSIWEDSVRYSQYFLGDWFLTGDMVIMDEDGYYYHQGRNDDLIKAGQEFVGPYEIEGVLRLHPAVEEAAVISKVGSTGTPLVKAFVTINKGFTPSLSLNHELRAFVKTNLEHQLELAEISFLDELPKTSSGKILRRVLRARELGLPSGDTLKLIG